MNAREDQRSSIPQITGEESLASASTLQNRSGTRPLEDISYSMALVDNTLIVGIKQFLQGTAGLSLYSLYLVHTPAQGTSESSQRHPRSNSRLGTALKDCFRGVQGGARSRFYLRRTRLGPFLFDFIGTRLSARRCAAGSQGPLQETQARPTRPSPNVSCHSTSTAMPG